MPPEFYADPGTVTRGVQQLLARLGYVLHTPAELYGSAAAARDAPDEDWLAHVSGRNWAILGRDLKTYERPWELAAYQRAQVQVFLLPGQVRAAGLAHLIEVNLARIAAITSTREPGTWRLTSAGPVPVPVRPGSAPAAADVRPAPARPAHPAVVPRAV